ncbi:alpha/beta hydrolase family protein [Shewanella maritima]|uniref:alpha/beta hydrolase family protein n=1 Tax=Shewanella maritima TaxID=2520507 RepID=UPI0037359B58
MKWILSALCCLAVMSSANADTSQQLPTEAFASIPDVSHVNLSPNGKLIASVIRLETEKSSGTAVSILEVATGKQFYPLRSDNDKFTIVGLDWANDNILLVSAKFPAVRFGVPTTETRLFKYNLADNKTSSILSKSLLKRFQWLPQFQNNIIDMLPEDEEHVLMQFRGMGNHPQYASVMKISLSGGRSHTVQPTKRYITDWITDRQHNVRIGIYRDDVTYRIYEQEEAKGDLRVLWEFDAFEENAIWPMGFADDPNILYVRAYHQDKKAIFKVNLKDKNLKKELVYSNPHYDALGSLVYSYAKKQVVGLTSGDDSEYTFWDEDYNRLLRGLNKALPDSENYIYDFSDNERRYILYSTSAVESGTFFYGDRDAKEMLPFAYRYGQLTPELMATTEVRTYKARDGLEIEAFVTLPKTKQSNLPTIVFPHGGPISHDSNRFDYWTQFFAHRGYAVLRMNFRGSSGYGYDFMKAGLQNWGLDMQNDVEDGTRWMIEQGIADPKRICVVGASYGGYAALMEVATNRDLYQCAVSVAGVTDVEYLVKSHRSYTGYEIVKKQIGDDYDALYERSPVSRAKDINVPVLLIHGEKDRVVRLSHSEDMFDELEDHDKQVEFIELEGGDHYLSDNKDRLQTFKAIERFLADNLHIL